MSTDYQRLMGIRSLNGRVDAFSEDVLRNRVFTSKMRQGRNMQAEDGTVEWDEVQYSRGLAPVAGLMGRHERKDPLTKIARSSAVMHVKRSVLLNPKRMYFEREAGMLRPNAEAYVEGEIRDLMNEIGNTLEYASAESCRGTLTVNDTNIPGSKQSFTIAYSPNTYAKAAGWGTAATEVLTTEIPALKSDYEQSCGLAPAQVICRNTVEGYIVGNTQANAALIRNYGPELITNTAARRGPMLGGIEVGGMRWEINEGGYIPEGGSFTNYLPTADEAIVLPEDSELPNVLGWAEGRGLVPNQLIGPAAAAHELVAPAGYGWYSYAAVDKGGPFVELFVGYVGLPIVLRPAAVCVGDLD